MITILKSTIFIFTLFVIFSSCTKDDATNLSLAKEGIVLKVGQSDTVNVTINFTGDAANVPITVKVSDSEIATAEVLTVTTPNETNLENSTIGRSVVIKALSSGTTNVVIQAGSQKITCPVTITQTTLILKQSLVVNYGLAIEEINNSVFIMYLLPETFFVDTASAIFAGNGQFIHFEAFAEAKQTSFATGAFSQKNNGGVNTFLPGAYDKVNGQSYPYGTYIETVDEEGKSTYMLVKSGTYTVNAEGEDYNIEGDLVTETNEIVHFSYMGQVSVVDKAEKPQEVHPEFTKGQLYYAGDVYNKGRSNTFLVYLETSNVDLSSDTLNGEVLILQLNAYDFYETHISTGIYKMLTQAQYEAFAVSPFTLIPGSFELFRDKVTNYGCWYYDANSRKRLISGSVDITYELNNYKIKYALSDRIGSLVTGSFTGTLSYVSLMSRTPAKVKSTVQKENTPHVLPPLMKQQTTNFGRIRENNFRCAERK